MFQYVSICFNMFQYVSICFKGLIWMIWYDLVPPLFYFRFRMNMYIDFPSLPWWFWRTFETMWIFFLTLGILGVLGFKWQGLHMKSMKATTDAGKDGKCSGVMALSRFYSSGHESHHPMENHLHWKVGCKVFSMLFLLINLIKPMSKTYFSHESLLFRGDISFLCFHFSRFLAWPKGPIGKHGKNTAPAAGPVPVAEACALAFARGTSAGARCGIATAGTGGWLIRLWFQRCKGAVDVELTDRFVDSVDWFVLDFES